MDVILINRPIFVGVLAYAEYIAIIAPTPAALPPVGSRWSGGQTPEADDILALWKYICKLFLIPFT